MRKNRGKGAGGGGRGEGEGENGKLENGEKKRLDEKGRVRGNRKANEKFFFELRLGRPKREQMMRRGKQQQQQTNKQNTRQEQLQKKGT